MSDAQYTKDHEWIRLEGDIAWIGITSYARDALGDLVYLELPETGRTLKKGEHFAVVESVKAASEIYTPVSGEIVEVNGGLADDLDGLKEDLETGWIVKVRISQPDDLKDLLDREAYQDFLKGL